MPGAAIRVRAQDISQSRVCGMPSGQCLELTDSPEEGRALAFAIARHTVHNIQPDLDVLTANRPVYSTSPDSLIAASQVVAIEFQTIAAANNYRRP